MAATIEPADYRSVLASVDKDGRRKWVEARIVWGRWRRLRAILALPLIVFYCGIPFVGIGGRPALQLDILARKFSVAGMVFWPQDLGYFVILVLMGIVGTLLAVALLGRVFCGWFCPHDVFLEMVFRPIEQLIRGAPGTARRRSPWFLALAWAAYAVVAGGLANAGTAVFVGAGAFDHRLILDWASHPYATVFWAVLFAAILFNFGWFREQTCTIVCPYGRFQTAMLDQHTLVVAYDARRGEPRGHAVKASSFELRASSPQVATASPAERTPSSKLEARSPSGDCVDCGLCVRVCPTAIDIRNGNQLECIHCAACIDACDSIMHRLGKPPGLVRYASEIQLAGQPRRVVRGRTILYAAVLVLMTGFLAWRLATRGDILVSPDQQTAVPVAERDPDGRDCVRAVLPMGLVNRTDRELEVVLALDRTLDARMILPQPRLLVPPNTRIAPMPIVYIPRDRFTVPHLHVTVEARDPAGRLLGSAVVGIRRP